MTHPRSRLLVLGIFLALYAAPATLVALVPIREPKEPTTPFIQWAIFDDFNSNEPHDPLVVEDKVIVGTDQGDLRAYRCKDGKPVWAHRHGQRIFHAPCSDGQLVYFSSAKGLTAVRVGDGTEAWNFGMRSCDGPTLVLAKRGLVYVGGDDGNLYALDARTGQQVWAADYITDAPPDMPKFDGARAHLANAKARPSALASDGEALYLSVFDQCRVVAVSAADGKRRWSFQTGGWVYGSAIATQKHVFIGSQDKAFYCLDKETGKKVWSYATKARIESGGAVDEKFVYFGSCDGGVYCLGQADGKPRWRFATDPWEGRNSAIYSVPVLRRGSLYIAAGEGQAYAIDRQLGELRGKVRPSAGSELFCSPATDGALFFVVTRAAGKGQGVPSLVAIGLK